MQAKYMEICSNTRSNFDQLIMISGTTSKSRCRRRTGEVFAARYLTKEDA
jgi:hypothetical protein